MVPMSSASSEAIARHSGKAAEANGAMCATSLMFTLAYSSLPFAECTTAGRSDEAKTCGLPWHSKATRESGCVPSAATFRSPRATAPAPPAPVRSRANETSLPSPRAQSR